MPPHTSTEGPEFENKVRDAMRETAQIFDRIKLDFDNLFARPIDRLDVNRPRLRPRAPYTVDYRVSLYTHLIDTIEEIGCLVRHGWRGIWQPKERSTATSYRLSRHRLRKDKNRTTICPYEEREKKND